VVAHADDAEFGCSGTVAGWTRQGWQVVYVLCTDGSKGSDDTALTQEALVAIRRQEQLDAAQVLGLEDVAFLGHSDSFLMPSLELRRDIARAIRKYKPDVLICPNPNRDLDSGFYIGHPDHQAAGEAALSAAYPTARDRLTYPELLAEGLEPHKVREVWVMMGAERADHVVELSEEDMERSILALKAHTSQVSPESADRMREWKQQRGEKAGFNYAETYKRFRLA